MKILQLVNTRWLSLGQCINGLLEMWKPVQQFVLNEHKKLKTKGRGSSKKHTAHPGKEKLWPKKHSASSTSLSKNSKYVKINPRSSLSGNNLGYENYPQYIISSQRLPVRSTIKSSNIHWILQATFSNKVILLTRRRRKKLRPRGLSQQKLQGNKGMLKLKLRKWSTAFLLYCLFLQATVPLFEQANLILQKQRAMHTHSPWDIELTA